MFTGRLVGICDHMEKTSIKQLERFYYLPKEKLIKLIKNGYTYKESDEQADKLSGSGSCVGCRLEDHYYVT